MKQGKNDCFKNGLKTDREFFTSGSVGELRFTGNVLLFWSAILLLPSDCQLFHSILLILLHLAQIAEYIEWY